jgi:hypothetical protein
VPFTFSPFAASALLARFVVEEVHATSIALGTNSVGFVTSSARDVHSFSVDAASTVAFFAVSSKLNRRNICVVWIYPIRFAHES